MHRTKRCLTRLAPALGLVVLLAGCPKSNRAPTIELFESTPIWGEAPLNAQLYWQISDPDGDTLTCTVDWDNDGVADETIRPCNNASISERTLTEPGRYPVTLTVSDGEQEVTRTIEIFSNQIQFATHVVFPEQHDGFVRAEIDGDQVMLHYRDEATAPEIEAGNILWGMSGNGYLRRVLAPVVISRGTYGQRFDLTTEPARIDEAIEQAKFGLRNHKMRFTDVVCLENCDRLESIKLVRPNEAGPKGGVTIGAEFDFPSFSISPGVKVKSGLDVSITIERFVVDIGFLGQLEEFTVELKPEVMGNVKLEVQLANKSVAKQDWPIGPRIGFAAVPIGPFVIIPNLEPKITAEVALEPKLTLKGTVGAEVVAGISFVRNEGTEIWGSLTPIYTMDDPTLKLGLGSAKVGIAPGFSFLMFNIAGPFIDPEIYLEGELSVDLNEGEVCLEAKVGAAANYGLEIDLFFTTISAEDTKVLAEYTFWETCEEESEDDCGDGTCDPAAENCLSCEDDCGACPADCGNGTLDPGELCDPPLVPCVATCNDQDPCTQDVKIGDESSCDVDCQYVDITQCTDDDQCCPAGCDMGSDNDCLFVCGDGIVDAGETCDPPTDCPTDCDDGDPCTDDVLSGDAQSCTAECSNPQITDCIHADGCCPALCDIGSDDDCNATCDNGQLEAGETCDPPSSCPTSCSDGDSCTRDVLIGSAQNCDAECTYPNITQCQSGDGCCPSGCSSSTDNDCAVCGDGVCEGNEPATCSSDCPPPSTDPCDGYGGWYCGATSQFPEGNYGTLYYCSGNVTQSEESCQCGCHVASAGLPDYCEECGLGEYGDTCSVDSQCASGNCLAGGCCVNSGWVEPGETCGSSSSCCSGRCTNGYCCWNPDPPGCII